MTIWLKKFWRNMKIAGCKTVEQWEELEQTLNNSNNMGWDCAFEFFEKRIETRYLKPIEAILTMEVKGEGEGFAVVNLQCSLIETMECFINGWIFNAVTDKKNKKLSNRWYHNNELVRISKNKHLKNLNIFESFFEKRIPFKELFIENNLKGNDFFWNVRCGLLHETQTKNGWEIRSDISSEAKSFVGKTIYREHLHSDIRKVIKKYKSAIVDGGIFDDEIGKEDLRQNFRDKFNHICKISKSK